jgi:hypothetical protein
MQPSDKGLTPAQRAAAARAAARAEAEAQALRANLARRKAQARQETSPPSHPTTPGDKNAGHA